MAIRRRALQRVGRFDEAIRVRGDEEDWERRYIAAGGRVRYLAAAGLVHRRTAADSRLRRLSRAAFVQGRAARRYDAIKGSAPPAGRRAARPRRLSVAHRAPPLPQRGRAHRALGRAAARGAGREAAMSTTVDVDDFMSGTSGQVHGIRATTRALLADGVCDAVALARLTAPGCAERPPAGRGGAILALGIERADVPNVLADAHRELARSRHEVRFASRVAGEQGKFENLNALLADNPPQGFDWLLIVDDDVTLPRGFLDSFVFLAERFELALAQPAHRWRSHAAYAITRRRPGAVLRETRFVEIGPLCALRSVTLRRAAAVPAAARRVGSGCPLVGARPRPRMAAGRRRRDARCATGCGASPAPTAAMPPSRRRGRSSPTARSSPPGTPSRPLAVHRDWR